VRIDRERIYALGSSMGGQETLLLVARHPRLLAGAAAMDSVTDLSRRYEQVLDLPVDPETVRRWGAPMGELLQSSMRREVGGTPANAARRYAARSPLDEARRIARSGVALQIWWSWNDAIVFDQEHQSQALYRELRSLGTDAPLIAYSGRWAHSKEMRATALLALALQDFELLPQGFKAVPAGVRRVATDA
jgi:pimeloyl-ACP methyl ester carboxylesterase